MLSPCFGKELGGVCVGLGPLGPCAKLSGTARGFPSKVCLYKMSFVLGLGYCVWGRGVGGWRMPSPLCTPVEA